MTLSIASNIRSRVLCATSWAYGRLRGGNKVRPGLRIFMYHAVGTPAHDDKLGIFSITPERFREHVSILAETRYVRAVPLVPVECPVQALRVAITFDDGYQDNLRVAAPILIEYGLPFSVFITTDFVRHRTKGFLNSSELKELAGAPGASVGAHGRSHRRLTECSDLELAEELTGSKRYLEDLLGRSVTTVAYPHGAVDFRVRNAAEEAGYSSGVCSYFNINQAGRDQLLLGRCSVLSSDSPRVFRQKLRGDWDWYRWRSTDQLRYTSEK